MKVYLVEVDNGELYDSYSSWIEKAFTTYRKASAWLIEKGYKPDFTYSIKGEVDVYFYLPGEEYLDSQAWITEIEIEE
jgi:hypothetical protein